MLQILSLGKATNRINDVKDGDRKLQIRLNAIEGFVQRVGCKSADTLEQAESMPQSLSATAAVFRPIPHGSGF